MTNRNISFIVKDQNPLMLRPSDLLGRPEVEKV